MNLSSNPSPAPLAAGLVFPLDADGARSTTRAGAGIVAAALEPLRAGLAAAARIEPHWRRAYPKHFGQLVEGALVDTDTALASARAGLATAWQTLRWAEAGHDLPLDQALQRAVAASPGAAGEAFRTHTVHGSGPAAPAAWTVPYRGEALHGDALRRRIDAWASDGIIEPSAAAALHRCATHPAWFDLADRTMVLLGAGSEAGPLR